MEIFGLVLFLIGVLLLIALVTAGKNDPSFTQISNAPVKKLAWPDWCQCIGGLYAGIGLAAFFLALVPYAGARFISQAAGAVVSVSHRAIADQPCVSCGRDICP